MIKKKVGVIIASPFGKIGARQENRGIEARKRGNCSLCSATTAFGKQKLTPGG